MAAKGKRFNAEGARRSERRGRGESWELLAGCDANLDGARSLGVKTTWKMLAPVDAGREYVALLSYLPLRAYLKIPLFARFSYAVHRQMLVSAGAMGYSMRAKLLSRQFWTLSVWESDRALMEFVAKVPHGEIMKALAPHMGATAFTRWKILGSGIPPRWDDADRRSAQES
jgi:hypothetical protein